MKMNKNPTKILKFFYERITSFLPAKNSEVYLSFIWSHLHFKIFISWSSIQHELYNALYFTWANIKEYYLLVTMDIEY